MIDFTEQAAPRLEREGTPSGEPLASAAYDRALGAGEHAHVLDHWSRLERFLQFGSEVGTYAVRPRALGADDAPSALACIAGDGRRVVRRVVELSTDAVARGREPALLVLALCAARGDAATRRAALAAFPSVARTGTHVHEWIAILRELRAWRRSTRRSVADWYLAQPVGELAHQLLKARSRNGRAHRETLRLVRPRATTRAQAVLFRYATDGWKGALELRGGVASTLWAHDVMERLEAVESLRHLRPRDAARVIGVYRLTREMVPAMLLGHAAVWDALLPRMPVETLVRHIGAMSAVGLLVPGSDATRAVSARLTDRAELQRSGVHPVALRAALRKYRAGYHAADGGRWTPVAQVAEAVDEAFYLSFANAPALRRRVLLALDVSGSMGSPVHGIDRLSCREAAAALALVTAATEPDHRIVAFAHGSSVAVVASALGVGSRSGLAPLAISTRDRLRDVVRLTSRQPFGGTDCALPMQEAARNGWLVDVFVVLTDHETRRGAGRSDPVRALQEYRQRTGIAAKLVVIGMASRGFRVADPNDSGMMDVCGFDDGVPGVVARFVEM